MNVIKWLGARGERRLMARVSARQVVGSVGAAALAAPAILLSTAMPSAAAQPCPDVEVVFARGTGEPPGVGRVGQAFVDALRWQLIGKSVGVHGVNYPASGDFEAGSAFVRTVVDGIRDASTRVRFVAATCPNTRIVLGGYSQGAVVAGFVTSAVVPEGVPPESVPAPMPPEVANQVAAVTLFGMPSGQFMHKYGAPAVAIGPLYAARTLELCAPGDTICSGAPDPGFNLAHVMYPANGMVGEAATFAASRLP